MRTISAMDLRKRLGETLDEAAAGERIVIERDRRPLAMLVPYSGAASGDETDEERRLRVGAALASLTKFGERIRKEYPGGPDAATAVRWDRDHGHTPDRTDDDEH
ncbi:MAG: type II toxin-antitoxin system Phd/YefM family antitoxin [Chloroflexota bacterium]|nr:type II toxin-antitoxin system Phd/YefM family antitoxin [Chloroflexota bacterium]